MNENKENGSGKNGLFIEGIYKKNNTENKISQGDILQDISFTIDSNILDYPYVVVMNQECDLSEDFNNRKNFSKEITVERKAKGGTTEFIKKKIDTKDKYLPMILCCPAYESTKFFNGSHILKPGTNTPEPMEIIGRDRGRKIIMNEDKRYHYLKESILLGTPNLVIDFKHFVTIPRDNIYDNLEKVYVGSLSELFREFLSQRFANFLSRIGLPEIDEYCMIK